MDRFLQKKWLLFIALLFPVFAFAQNIPVSGVITDYSNG